MIRDEKIYVIISFIAELGHIVKNYFAGFKKLMFSYTKLCEFLTGYELTKCLFNSNALNNVYYIYVKIIPRLLCGLIYAVVYLCWLIVVYISSRNL